MPEVLDRTEEARQVPPSTMLIEKIGVVRRKRVQTAAGTGLSMVVGTVVLVLGMGMVLDWWLDFPWALRAMLLLAETAAIGWMAWQFVIVPLARQPDDDMVALIVEKARPEFRSRLISSLQLTLPGAIPAGAAPVMVRALVTETEAMAGPVDFNAIIPTRDLKKTALWAFAALALGISSFIGGGEVSRDLLKRAFLFSTPVPRKTLVTSLTGDTKIGRGDSVRIEASAKGVIPSAGRLKIIMSNRRDQEFPMEKDKEQKEKFARAIENVQQSFQYVVYLNDGSSQTHQVEVLPRPIVTTILCDQVYPAYTRLPNVRRSLGDLSLLAGSRLRLSVVASKEIKSASIRLVGLTNAAPLTMQVSATNARILHAEIPIPAKGLTGFSVDMIDSADMRSATNDTAVYRVEIVPDKAPSARIIYPDRKEELITRQATMLVSFEAVDDFQVSKARIRYKQGESDSDEVKTIDLDIGAQVLTRVRNRYEWKISSITPALNEGSRFEFWIEVEDNNNVTGPGVGQSDHHLARVVSTSAKREDLLNRAGDYLSSIAETASDQQKLNENLGKIILAKPVPK